MLYLNCSIVKHSCSLITFQLCTFNKHFTVFLFNNSYNLYAITAQYDAPPSQFCTCSFILTSIMRQSWSCTDSQCSTTLFETGFLSTYIFLPLLPWAEIGIFFHLVSFFSISAYLIYALAQNASKSHEYQIDHELFS